MSRISTKKVSTLALLTSAVFTISSLAPVDFAAGPFSPDAAFAKSENANGGNRGGNGNGNAGGNSGGKGGEKSASNGGNNGGGKGVGNNGGGKGVGKGVGGSIAKATQRGGNLVKSLFGRNKVKPQKAAVRATTPKVKPKDLLAAMGYHPSDVKGWNGVFHANPNAAMHASVNSIHGRAAAAFAQQMIADTAATDALAAADAANAALEAFVALDGDPNAVPTEADYTAAQQSLIDLAAAPVLDEAAMAGAQAVVDQYEAYQGEGGVADLQTAAQDLQQIADQEQAEAVSAFEAVTPNVDYTAQKADDFYSMMEQNQAMIDRVNGIVEAEAEAAAAAEAETVVEEETVVLRTGDGETIALAVQ